MSASVPGRRVSRPVERLLECPCELLDAAPVDIVSFDHTPAFILTDDGDRYLALNIAQVALSLHAGSTDALEWSVEADTEDAGVVNIMTKYPRSTCFTLQQLNFVHLVNELRVRSVWVQPEEDCVYLGVAMCRSDVVQQVTVQDIVILRRAIDSGGDAPTKSGPRKRLRASAPNKKG